MAVRSVLYVVVRR